MVAIPQTSDPTLEAVDTAIELRGNARERRAYLGMSEIGKACRRALWYGFRWCSKSQFDALSLKRFEDGFHGEDVQASRLRMIKQVTLQTIDPRTGKQFGYSDIGGHFKGHQDGAIQGLLQAPAAPHIWEHKQVGEKKQAGLEKLKLEHGEKEALQQWDPIYYAQAMLYCDYSGLTRHYLTCASPGGRRTVSARTNANPEEAEKQRQKAEQIITASEPLERLSDRPDWYECKWCDYHDVCHGGRAPEVSCRTCAHATPALDGDGRWICERYKIDIPANNQRNGCLDHVFIPALITFAKAVDANSEESWVEYKKQDGTVFRNGKDDYTSWEINAVDPSLIGDPFIEDVKKTEADLSLTPKNQPDTSSLSSPAEPAATFDPTPSGAAPVAVPAPWEVTG